MDYEREMARILRIMTDDHILLFVNENKHLCCPYCLEEATYRVDFMHRMSCPVRKARRILEEVDAG